MVLATHLIWTTYGTWLPGDDRGHWSPLFDMYGHLLRKGHRLNMPDEVTRGRAIGMMKEPPKILNAQEMAITAEVIGKVINGIPVGRFTPGKPGALCAAYALAIEHTHVHLLIGPLSESLSATVGRFKGVSSSLIVSRPENGTRQRTWTADFWKVFLFDAEGVATVCKYVIDHNVRAGRPAHPWAFTRVPRFSW